MKIRIPSCFAGFRCTASACKDNCCIGWEIDVDESSLAAYRRSPAPFGDRLRENIVTEPDGTAHFRLLPDERCPFLNHDNLCDIFLQLGEDALCEICSQHPRFHHFYGSLQETGFGLCCEEAGRLLFSSAQPITLLERRTSTPSEPEDAALSLVLSIRAQLFSLLQNRSLPLGERFALLLLYGNQVQDWCDSGGEGSLPDLPAVPPSSLPDTEDSQQIAADWPELFSVFGEMESINAEWDEALHGAVCALSLPDRPALETEFCQAMAARSYEYEHFVYYFLYRYLLEATKDGDLVGRVKLALVSVLLLRQLDFACWLKNRKSFTLQDRISNARIFSKELEYSEENMAFLMDELLFPGLFSDDCLLILLKQARF